MPSLSASPAAFGREPTTPIDPIDPTRLPLRAHSSSQPLAIQ